MIKVILQPNTNTYCTSSLFLLIIRQQSHNSHMNHHMVSYLQYFGCNNKIKQGNKNDPHRLARDRSRYGQAGRIPLRDDRAGVHDYLHESSSDNHDECRANCCANANNEITPDGRKKIVDWCYKIVDRCQFQRDTVAVATNTVECALKLKDTIARSTSWSLSPHCTCPPRSRSTSPRHSASTTSP